jgi:signal transduction histidine kinase
MFRNLSASAKLLFLCGLFLISLAVTTYSLVLEKRIAIQFAQRELIGSHYVAALRPIYEALLTNREASPDASHETLVKALDSAESDSGGEFQTAGLAQALEKALRDVTPATAIGSDIGEPILNVLAEAQSLISRVGDDSYLALDPDLDSYYLQFIVVNRMPALLGQLAEMRAMSGESASEEPFGDQRKVRLQVLAGSLLAMLDGTGKDLDAALRGNSDGRIKNTVDASLRTALASALSYFAALRDSWTDNQAEISTQSLDRIYASAAGNVLDAWRISQSELDRLLQERIDRLLARMRGSLALTGTLGALSILVAYLTHHHIVGPLRRLETVARTVRETRDYSLRVSNDSRDEIGQLSEAFNDMLSELSAARERDLSEQAELARITKLTTVGAMTASIAHEINQPLAAIVTNSNAALRWLASQEPDFEEARAALRRIVRDGHRASEIIGGIRAMFKKDHGERTRLNINELARDVLLLAHASLESHQVSVRSDLREDVPDVFGDRVQLQQVLLNLIINGAEAMASVTDRPRLLQLTTDRQGVNEVIMTLADCGTGIDPEDMKRIFEPFYTTKASGMGMGLSICRSIIESHGGKLWATALHPHGTEFHVAFVGLAASDEGS